MYFPCIGHIALECILLHHQIEIRSHIRFSDCSSDNALTKSAALPPDAHSYSNLRTGIFA
jgi:hypothetical protein